MEIGERIREARKSLGWTQQQLAEKAGVAAITIRQYEAGKRIPRLDQLQKIAKAMGVSISHLCTEKERIILSRQLAYQMGVPSFSPDDFLRLVEARRDCTKAQKEVESLTKITQAQKIMEQLNEIGQQVAIERLKELTEIPRYRADSPQNPLPPSDDKDPAGE